MSILIKLDYGEMLQATAIASARRTKHCIRRMEHNHSIDHLAWDSEINGCIGEIAIAKYLNLFWSGDLFGQRNGRKDVGGLVEVRAKFRKPDQRKSADLILHDSDESADPYALALVYENEIAVPGWIFAGDGKRAEYWRDPVGGRPAYFVPQKILLPMPELKIWAHQRILQDVMIPEREAAE